MAMIASVTATGQNTMSVNIQNTPSGSYIVRVHRKGDASNVWIGSQNVNVPNDAYSANVYFTFYYGNTVSDVDYVSLFDSKYSLLHTKYVSLYYASAPSAPATLTYASSFNSYNRASAYPGAVFQGQRAMCWRGH